MQAAGIRQENKGANINQRNKQVHEILIAK